MIGPIGSCTRATSRTTTGDSVETLYDVLDESESEALFAGNAAALYRLDL